MKEVSLREILSNVSWTLVGSDEFVTADLKIEIENKSDPRYCHLLFNYPHQLLRGASGSNQGLIIRNPNVRVSSLGEVRVYVKGELKEYWKTFLVFWKKYKD
jgi:hypothetical protein